MPLNRRRFISISGLAVGATGAGIVAWSKSTAVQSEAPNAVAVAAATEALPASAIPTSSANSSANSSVGLPMGPADLFAPQRGNIRIAVISDLNGPYGSTDYLPEVITGISLLPDWQPDIVLCSGDMVAGQSLALTQSEVAAMWNAFDEKILSPIRTANLPFALTVGNHDASSYKNGDEFVYVLDRQESAKYWDGHQSDTDLQFIEADGFPFYYSFKQDDIFYLTWDASSANVAPEQVAWADRALSSPEARSAKLRIVLGHLPMYAVAQRRDRPGEYLNEADQLRQLLESHNVHTYISGHHHAYFPGKAGSLNTLHTGALGNGPRPLLATNTEPFQTLTIMDLFLETASTVYTTYNMKTMEVVDLQSLPRQVIGPNGRELRQDVAPQDLTPAEQAQSYSPS